MIAPKELLDYVKAEPFRPFRIHMASGKDFDIKHPEMIRIGKNSVIIFTFVSGDPAVYDEWTSASLLLAESVSHLETPVA